MADQQLARDLSLVPYSTGENNAVILRHNDAVVVYDAASRQLVLQGVPPSTTVGLPDATCPLCHQTVRNGTHDREHNGSNNNRDTSEPVEADFVSPEYFRRLRSYPTAPAESSPPPSPRRRLAQPIESAERLSPRQPTSTDVQGSSEDQASRHGISSEAFCPDYFRRFFVEERVLGKGGKGEVLLVHHYLDGVFLGDFACKRVPVGDDHEWLKKVLVEVVLLQQLSHQNLVSYRHVWLEDMQVTKFGPSVPCAFILQQYCNAGDLLQYVCSPTATDTPDRRKSWHRRRSKGNQDPLEDVPRACGISFDEIYSFFKDITSGLNYLHVNGFIHRDLKPSNCLLHRTGQDTRVLVSDFGEAQETNKARGSSGATGTISFCAPEVLCRQPTNGRLGEFSVKSDIFSLGMILYFMCFGRLPYVNADNLNEESEDLEQLRDEIGGWKGFEDDARPRTDLPEQLYRFLKRLLSVDPTERPSAEDILRGISSGGGLSDGPHNHHLNVNGAFEGVRNGSRISPIDTPPPSTPINHWQGRKPSIANQARPGPSKLRPVFTQGAHDPSTPGDRASDDDDDDDDDDALSNSSSLVLRKGSSQSTSTPQHCFRAPVLPAADPMTRIRHSIHRPSVYKGLQASLIVFKVFTMQQSCSPFAVRPEIFYPLLALAMLDLAGGGRSESLTIALTTVHFGVLFAAGRWAVLCRIR